MNSRLPPSLLRYGKFWGLLKTHVTNWMFETFNVECDIEIETRQNIDGKAAAEIVSDPTSYVLLETEFPLPTGVLLSPEIMTKYAAMRLNEQPDRLSGTSPVFLQLLCEGAVKDLLCRLSEWLAFSSDTMAVTDPLGVMLTTSPINNTKRYAEIVLKLKTSDENFSLTFIVELDIFLSLHDERLRRLRGGFGGGVTNPALRRSVRSSMLDLEVVIDRLDMSIADCMRIEVGDEVPLPSGDRGKLNLVAKTIRGDEEIALGELGIWKNFRALKLSTPVSDGFLRNLVEL